MPEQDEPRAPQCRPRRQVLTVTAAVVGAGVVSALAGCRVRLEQAPVVTPPPATPDEIARAKAASETDRLLGLVDDVRRLRPDAAALLGRIATEHQAHLSALRLAPSTTTPTPKPTITPTSTSTPLTKGTALAVLGNREKQAAEAVRAQLTSVSAELARLLASVAASCDCHADALTTVGAA